MLRHGEEAGSRVDKVVRLIGTSDESWEGATRAAIAEAAKTIRDLTGARVAELDMVVVEGGAAIYRARVEVTFRVDRHRQSAAGLAVEVRRYLIVGNETLTGPALREDMVRRFTGTAVEVHVLVPCTPLRGVHVPPLVLGDPLTGYIDPEAIITSDLDEDARDRARRNLDMFCDVLAGLGVEATGEVGVANPVRALQQVLDRASFDEILLCTLPAGISRWLRMDLPSRVRRVTSVAVTAIELEAEPPSPGELDDPNRVGGPGGSGT